ncbi:MAG: NAD(P)/FAD-dependent oxidoreductase [Candidatus Tectomicrobia bacterium]|uniref:Pyridine nucleotide-disulfide oxidoreductase domain-containing protein 2 n=1 Tax=Tectimicrobiota bacterium TaxID=2528274 RepID=A0A932HVU3_UNCTE|nr:NAD(P)/FAD-dependent oxidoreductase [Candidatus Tectomicrobia bacterium]
MPPPTKRARYDAVVAGGGHNGLVAAAYLAGAGLSVLVLERRERTGGAAVSERLFPGFEAELSPYAYLVSLFPRKIAEDLGLRFEMRRRRVASCTPYEREGRRGALLISNEDERITEASFRALPDGKEEYAGFRRLQALARAAAERLWPTLLGPLPSREEMRARFRGQEAAWDFLFERPLGEGIERHLRDDLVRGLVFTDATIGVLADPHDPGLLQNRTFLYHAIGNGTGDWCVPVGGMGRLTGELAARALASGAEILTGAEVTGIEPETGGAGVRFRHAGEDHAAGARWALVNLAPRELARVLPGYREPWEPEEGAFLKINMLLERLPRLKGGVGPADAFRGTFHAEEGYANIRLANAGARGGAFPSAPPVEVYCHTLTDPSILSPELAARGCHSLGLFGLAAPHGLFLERNEAAKAEQAGRCLASLEAHLEEPLGDCLLRGADGRPCVEVKSPLDVERELGMPLGNIFHGRLAWPFAEREEEGGAWGVETGVGRVLLCGSGARRGGCVSGIPGHNAAMKVLGRG